MKYKVKYFRDYPINVADELQQWFNAKPEITIINISMGYIRDFAHYIVIYTENELTTGRLG